MKFIDAILNNSPTKEAKLFGPATKASQVPETGIKIVNKSAYNVIKDCATLTTKYLPHYIFGLYAEPWKDLHGKIDYDDIVEFVNHAKEDMVLNQLLVLIKHKLTQYSIEPVPIDASDPYCEYGSEYALATMSDAGFLARYFVVS